MFTVLGENPHALSGFSLPPPQPSNTTCISFLLPLFRGEVTYREVHCRTAQQTKPCNCIAFCASPDVCLSFPCFLNIFKLAAILVLKIYIYSYSQRSQLLLRFCNKLHWLITFLTRIIVFFLIVIKVIICTLVISLQGTDL